MPNITEEVIGVYIAEFENLIEVGEGLAGNRIALALIIQQFLGEVPDEPEMLELRELVQTYLNQIILGEDVEDTMQFFTDIAEVKNQLRWLLYETVLQSIKHHKLSQRQIGGIIGCSQSKIAQYAKSAETFPANLRVMDVPVAVYDAARDVTVDSNLNPIDVLALALEEGMSPREIKEYIESNRPIKELKLSLEGRGKLDWEGSEMKITPDLDYDSSQLKQFDKAEIRFSLKEL